MKTEITRLVQVTAMTGALWIPYVLNRVVVRGICGTVGYPQAPKALAPWAERLRAAHANAVENLVVFAALVLAAQAAGISTPVTVLWQATCICGCGWSMRSPTRWQFHGCEP